MITLNHDFCVAQNSKQAAHGATFSDVVWFRFTAFPPLTIDTHFTLSRNVYIYMIMTWVVCRAISINQTKLNEIRYRYSHCTHTNYLITPHSEQWNGMNLPFKPNSGYLRSEYLNFHVCFECVYRNEWFFHLPQISFNFPFLFRIVRFSIRPKLDWKSWANPYVQRYGSKWEENSI